MSSLSSSEATFDYCVIIVTHNSVHEVKACLASILPSHPGAKFQLIVVDNASEDTTFDLLHQHKNRRHGFAAFELIRNSTNVGFTVAINQALQRARARYVLFLNPDTVLPEGGLQKLREILCRDPRLGVVAPQLRNPDGSLQPSCRRFPRHRDVFFTFLGFSFLFPQSRLFNGWKMGDFDHRTARQVEQPQGAFLLAKWETVQKIGRWDKRFPMFFSDVDWCQRVVKAGYGIRFSPEVQVTHWQGKSVRSKRASMILSSHRSFIRYFWKNFPSPRYWLPNLAVTLMLAIATPVRYVWAWAQNRGPSRSG